MKIFLNITIILVGIYIYFVYGYGFIVFLFVLPSVLFLYTLTTKNIVIKKTGTKFLDNKDITAEYSSLLEEFGMRKSLSETLSKSSNINMSLIPKFRIWQIKTIKKAMLGLKDMLSK